MPTKKDKVKKAANSVYSYLFKINDTPQKIALGFAIGVFTGIIPGIGPLTALFFSFLFKANRASALLGTLITNTWLTFLTFAFSIKISAIILGIKWQNIYNDWMLFLSDFKFSKLFNLSVIKIILPVLIGYMGLALILGILVYLLTFIIFSIKKHVRVKTS